MIIGYNKSQHGVREVAPLHQFLLNGFFNGLTLDLIEAEDIVLITDPGQDQDDEMAMVLLRDMVHRGFFNCRAVVANLRPSIDRARLARGTLDVLGLSHVPVGVGSDGGSSTHVDNFSESSSAYIPSSIDPATSGTSSVIHPDGQQLLLEVYEKAPLGGLVMVCISSLKDAAKFLSAHEELFVSKVELNTLARFPSSEPMLSLTLARATDLHHQNRRHPRS